MMARQPDAEYTIYGAVKYMGRSHASRVSEKYGTPVRGLDPLEQAWGRVFDLRHQCDVFDIVLIETTYRPAKNSNHWRPVEKIIARFGKGKAWFEPTVPCESDT